MKRRKYSNEKKDQSYYRIKILKQRILQLNESITHLNENIKNLIKNQPKVIMLQFNELPLDIFLEIFKYLSKNEKKTCSTINRKFNIIYWKISIWFLKIKFNISHNKSNPIGLNILISRYIKNKSILKFKFIHKCDFIYFIENIGKFIYFSFLNTETNNKQYNTDNNNNNNNNNDSNSNDNNNKENIIKRDILDFRKRKFEFISENKFLMKNKIKTIESTNYQNNLKKLKKNHLIVSQRIVVLDIQNFFVSIEILKSLEGMSNMKKLKIKININDPINNYFEHINNLHKLTSLDLMLSIEKYPLEKEAIDLNFIDMLTKLKNLRLYFYIKGFQDSKIIDIKKNGLENIGNLINLTKLKMINCNVKDADLNCFQKLYNLEYLTIEEWRTNDMIIFAINEANSITITDKGLKCLKVLKKLTHISFIYCTKITDDGMNVLMPHLVELIYINISKCKKITDATLLILSTFLKSIKYLILDECNITSKGLVYLTPLRKLIKLSLSNCENITIAGINSLGVLKCLKYLILINCSQFDILNTWKIKFSKRCYIKL